MKTKLEQAAAESAAQEMTESAITEALNVLGYDKTSAQGARLERQITFCFDKAEGVPCQKDGTPYSYTDAGTDALDNCNRQLEECSDLRAVWCGKCSHNGNIMYRLTYCGSRYYHYRDLVRLLGAPSQRAEKSEASKARKAAAIAAAALAEEQAAQLAAAQAQLQRLQTAMAAAAKDGMLVSDMQAAIDREDKAAARAAAMADYRATLLARGNSEQEANYLVSRMYPEQVGEKQPETALLEQKAAAVDTVTSQPAKAAKKAVKGTKKGNK